MLSFFYFLFNHLFINNFYLLFFLLLFYSFLLFLFLFCIFQNLLNLCKFDKFLYWLEGYSCLTIYCFVVYHFIHIIWWHRANNLFSIFIIPYFSIFIEDWLIKWIKFSKRTFFIDFFFLLTFIFFLLISRNFNLLLLMRYWFLFIEMRFWLDNIIIRIKLSIFNIFRF